MAKESSILTEKPVTGTGTLLQLFLGLLWLGTSMYTAHATITGNTDDASGPLGSAASALPGVIAAALVTGASIGSAASSRFKPAILRLLVGLGIGAVFGAVAAAGIRFGYGAEQSIMVLAVTVGIASALGGALAVLPNDVLEAALWATTWVFFAGVIFGVLQPNATTLLGGGPTADAAAQATADTRFVLATSILTGLAAGVYSYRSVRGERRGLHWYVIAGALPGVLLVVAEYLTRRGGTALVQVVNGFGEGDPTLGGLSDAGRLRHGLIVLAVGGLVAVYGGVRAIAAAQKEAAGDRRETEDAMD